MLGTDFTKNKKAQSGSVMLEVIAVLALMGVMGAMLFRQIYQRNQELHNIQMASEIRTVKEALSAYIQAHRTELLGVCHASDDPADLLPCGRSSKEIGAAIKDYLPMGWFMGGNPDGYYTLSLWTYKLADASQKQVIHGLIAPKDTTLPQTGWNFKRAARVALLIGADGGVYDSNITGGTIAGALGTWQLGVDGRMGLLSNTYVAMTGLDIFTPEYNLPEGNVNLYDDWDLATQKLGAWNYFSAGSTKDCFDVNHGEVEDRGGRMMVKQDIFNACQPLFYVKKEDGISKVFVNNDLEIGQGENANVTITQEGVIKQKNGLTIDADGRIISKDVLDTAIGDLKKDERYLLDPAHTSVMNDIYLTSRGGVRLSDILPNYILKGVSRLVPTDYSATNKRYEVSKPTCPKGYKKAIVITPISWNQEILNNGKKLSGTGYGAGATDQGANGTIEVTIPETSNVVEGSVTVDVPAGSGTGTGSITSSKIGSLSGTANVTTLSVTEGICVSISDNGGAYDNGHAAFNLTDNETGKWYIKMAAENDNANCKTVNMNQDQVDALGIVAVVQTYCVFEPTVYNTQPTCESAGFAWDSGKCIPGLGEADCKNAGFTWDATNKRCKYIYSLGSINGISDLTKRAATCKAAGETWNGTTCS